MAPRWHELEDAGYPVGGGAAVGAGERRWEMVLLADPTEQLYSLSEFDAHDMVGRCTLKFVDP
jgi:hypothetical protein